MEGEQEARVRPTPERCAWLTQRRDETGVGERPRECSREWVCCRSRGVSSPSCGECAWCTHNGTVRSLQRLAGVWKREARSSSDRKVPRTREETKTTLQVDTLSLGQQQADSLGGARRASGQNGSSAPVLLSAGATTSPTWLPSPALPNPAPPSLNTSTPFLPEDCFKTHGTPFDRAERTEKKGPDKSLCSTSAVDERLTPNSVLVQKEGRSAPTLFSSLQVISHSSTPAKLSHERYAITRTFLLHRRRNEGGDKSRNARNVSGDPPYEAGGAPRFVRATSPPLRRHGFQGGWLGRNGMREGRQLMFAKEILHRPHTWNGQRRGEGGWTTQHVDRPPDYIREDLYKRHLAGVWDDWA